MALVVALMLVAGCTSARPTPITSIEPLVGKWAGTVIAGRGYQQFFYLTINPDRTFVAEWGINWSWGAITVANGQATYEMTPPPREGTLRLYQELSRARDSSCYPQWETICSFLLGAGWRAA